jgi:hypothetical protein
MKTRVKTRKNAFVSETDREKVGRKQLKVAFDLYFISYSYISMQELRFDAQNIFVIEKNV